MSSKDYFISACEKETAYRNVRNYLVNYCDHYDRHVIDFIDRMIESTSRGILLYGQRWLDGYDCPPPSTVDEAAYIVSYIPDLSVDEILGK